MIDQIQMHEQVIIACSDNVTAQNLAGDSSNLWFKDYSGSIWILEQSNERSLKYLRKSNKKFEIQESNKLGEGSVITPWLFGTIRDCVNSLKIIHNVQHN